MHLQSKVNQDYWVTRQSIALFAKDIPVIMRYSLSLPVRSQDTVIIVPMTFVHALADGIHLRTYALKFDQFHYEILTHMLCLPLVSGKITRFGLFSFLILPFRFTISWEISSNSSTAPWIWRPYMGRAARLEHEEHVRDRSANHLFKKEISQSFKRGLDMF